MWSYLGESKYADLMERALYHIILANPALDWGHFFYINPFVIDLDLQIEPQLIASNPRLDATRGSLAIQRGPLVYCLEDCDQEVKGRLLDVQLGPGQPLHLHWEDDLLGGVMVIDAADGLVDMRPWHGSLYQPARLIGHVEVQPVHMVAVPYYAWANRSIGGMRVWIKQVGLGHFPQ